MSAPLSSIKLPYQVTMLPPTTGDWEMQIPSAQRNAATSPIVNHELKSDATITITYDGPEPLEIRVIKGNQPRRKIGTLPSGPAGIPRTSRAILVPRGGLTSLIQIAATNESGGQIQFPQSSIDAKYAGCLTVYPLVTFDPATM